MSGERNRIMVNGPYGPVLMQVGAIPKVGDRISIINLWAAGQPDRIERVVGQPTATADQAVHLLTSLLDRNNCFPVWRITQEHAPLKLKGAFNGISFRFFEAEEVS